MKTNERLKATIDFLRSQQAILVVLILALLAQLPHTAWVFQRISTTSLDYQIWGFNIGYFWGWVLAYTAATSVELAVLMFVVRGRNAYSWGFAACSVLMNLFYYWQPTWSLTATPYSVAMMSALLWSLLLPGAIALYSHEIKHGEHVTLTEQPETQQNAAEGLNEIVEQTLPANAFDALTVVPLAMVGQPEPHANGYNDLTPFGANALATIQHAIQQHTPAKQPTKQKQPAKPTGKPTGDRLSQVASLVMAGKTNAEIARILGISDVTVRGYQAQLRKQTKGITNDTSNDNGTATSTQTAGWETDSRTGETDWTPTLSADTTQTEIEHRANA